MYANLTLNLPLIAYEKSNAEEFLQACCYFQERHSCADGSMSPLL